MTKSLPRAESPEVRWPDKPKKKDTCDAVKERRSGQMIRCGEPAIETCLAGDNYLTYLCQEHAIELEERDHVRRNPRLKNRKK